MLRSGPERRDIDRRPAPEPGKGSHVNSHRLPRTVVPSRYDIRLEPDLESATYAGEEIVQVEIRDETDEVQLNAVELTITSVVARGRGRRPARGHGVARPGDGPRAPSLPPRAPSRRVEPPHRLPGHPERPAPRLLSQHLQGRRRADARHGGDAVRGRRRAPRVPVLGRAGPQGRVRRDARGARGLHRDLEHGARPRGAGGARPARGDVRGHHPDVDLPGRVHRRRARVDRAGHGRQDAAPRLERPGQAPPGRATPGRPGPSASTSSSATTASRIRATRWTCWRSPTSRRARWRTSAPSRSARPRSWSTRRPRPTRTWSASRTWSRTSSRTCGSATS